MQNSSMNRETIVTEMESGRRNREEVLRDLQRAGSIFFEKTLKRTNARNLHTNKSEVGIPRWFIDSHGDKFREIVYLIAGPTTRTWTARLYLKVRNIGKNKFPDIKICRGWNEFAAFHGLVENDRLIFSLKAMSEFEVYIFHRTGEPKESSFPTSRKPSIEVHELLQMKGYEKSRKRATKMQGQEMTAAQLVKDQIAQGQEMIAAQLAKDQIAQQLNARKRASRKKDAIPSQKPLHSALHLFKPQVFVHNIPVQCRHFPEVIDQEPSDDVHQELVMPFTKNSVEISRDFVETKITSVGFVDKNQAQIQSQTSPPSFLSPSTFRNFNNLGGNMRVQTVVVLNGIPEMNGEAGDQALNLFPVVQSDPSAVVQPLVLESRRESEQPIGSVPTAKGGTRHHRPWTLGEVIALVECVAQCGVGKWADIKMLGFSTVGYRTVIDLKDKWRNLLRASQAQLHPAKQGQRKKQFTSSIPAPILARVRELASLPNQIPSGTSRKWRTVHRK